MSYISTCTVLPDEIHQVAVWTRFGLYCGSWIQFLVRGKVSRDLVVVYRMPVKQRSSDYCWQSLATFKSIERLQIQSNPTRVKFNKIYLDCMFASFESIAALLYSLCNLKLFTGFHFTSSSSPVGFGTVYHSYGTILKCLSSMAKDLSRNGRDSDLATSPYKRARWNRGVELIDPIQWVCIQDSGRLCAIISLGASPNVENIITVHGAMQTTHTVLTGNLFRVILMQYMLVTGQLSQNNWRTYGNNFHLFQCPVHIDIVAGICKDDFVIDNFITNQSKMSTQEA
jgi:hypothetical protein